MILMQVLFFNCLRLVKDAYHMERVTNNNLYEKMDFVEFLFVTGFCLGSRVMTQGQ